MIARQNNQQSKTSLKTITVSGMKGYTLSSIQKSLNPKQFAQFRSWLIGQTVGEYKHEAIIYEQDFEQFIAGLPPRD